MRRVMVVSLLGVAVMAVGCAHKKPATAAPPQPQTPYASAAVESPEAQNGMPMDPLTGDLDAVNEYVRSHGLLRDVYFDYDSAELSADARQALAANARFLGDHASFAVTVEGHCDERGTTEYNLALGDRRATATRQYLAQLGVDGGRMEGISFGEERPSCTLSAEGCWSQNRRSHLVIARRTGAS